MKQHPIPQQISSYEFHLVGSMTLKQFFKLASGLIIAFIFYSTNLVFFIKWPLVLGFGFLGVALAFLPVNERPLEIWIFSFIRSIFSPSIYLWQKQTTVIDLLQDDFGSPSEEPTLDEKPEFENKEPQLEEYIASLPSDEKEKKVPSDEREKEKEPREDKKEKVKKTKPQIEINLPEQPKPLQATAKAEFGEIPMPETPDTPNIIVGMITSQEGKMVENAIIEIQDTEGNPVRALRTNQLGQFRTATPLVDGRYLIIPEKEGFQFDIIEVSVQGKVVSPLKIKAKN